MDTMPFDIVGIICKYLNKCDILNLYQSSKKLLMLINSDKLYIEHNMKKYEYLTLVTAKSNKRYTYILIYNNVPHDYLYDLYSLDKIIPMLNIIDDVTCVIMPSNRHRCVRMLQFIFLQRVQSKFKYSLMSMTNIPIYRLQPYENTDHILKNISIKNSNIMIRCLTTVTVYSNNDYRYVTYQTKIIEAIVFRNEIPKSFSIDFNKLTSRAYFETNGNRIVPIGGLFNSFENDPMYICIDKYPDMSNNLDFDIIYFIADISSNKGIKLVSLSFLQNNKLFGVNKYSYCTSINNTLEYSIDKLKSLSLSI